MDNEKAKLLQNLIWPAIIKFPDDAELLYIHNQAEWDSDSGLHSFNYDEMDCLIDSSGQIFNLVKKLNGIVQPELTTDIKQLEDILGLVKGHASQMGSCCVSKLYAPSISEAFKIVNSLSDH